MRSVRTALFHITGANALYCPSYGTFVIFVFIVPNHNRRQISYNTLYTGLLQRFVSDVPQANNRGQMSYNILSPAST